MLWNVSSSVAAALGSGEYYTKSGPASAELDDALTWFLELNDPGGDVIGTAEITPGTYTVDRLRNGVTTNIVASTAASEAAGRIYATYTPVGASFALGDVILVTFSAGTITISGTGVTTTLPNAYFYTRLSREEDIYTRIGAPIAASISADLQVVDVNVDDIETSVGAQADAAVQTAANASLQGAVKGLRTSLGNPSGDTLTTITAKWGNLAQSFASWAGDMSGHALTSIAAKWGNMTETLLVVLGARADAATQTTADASMHARLKGLLTSLGNPSGDTLTSITAKVGNNAEALTTTLGVQADAAIQTTGVATLQAGNKGLRTSVGDPSGHTLTSLTAKFGNSSETLLTSLGRSVDSAIQDTSATTVNAGVRGLRTSVGNPSADTLTSLTTKLGNLSLALSSILQPARTNISVGPSDYNAAPVTVVSIDTTQNTMVSGIYLDVNGFTNGATLTATLKIKVGAGNNQRQVRRTFVKDANNNLFIILDSESPITSNTDSLEVALQSDNAGDNAATAIGTYFTRSVS